MKRTLISALALLAAFASTARAEMSELSCKDFRPTAAALERFPNLVGACEGVVERDGELYGLFSAKVKRVKGSRVTLYMPATDRTVTVKPEPSMRVKVGKRKLMPRDLRAGDKLSIYINLDEFAKPDIQEVALFDARDFFVATPSAVTPGRVLTSLVERVAIIEAVNQEARELKLIDAQGNRFDLVVNEKIPNFELLEPRDRVIVGHLESVALLVLPADQPQLPNIAAVEVAVKDGKPSALIADTVMVKATIESLNRSDRSAVLRGKDGETRTIKVGDDVDLGLVKVGDEVRLRITKAVALTVRKADKS